MSIIIPWVVHQIKFFIAFSVYIIYKNHLTRNILLSSASLRRIPHAAAWFHFVWIRTLHHIRVLHCCLCAAQGIQIKETVYLHNTRQYIIYAVYISIQKINYFFLWNHRFFKKLHKRKRCLERHYLSCIVKKFARYSTISICGGTVFPSATIFEQRGCALYSNPKCWVCGSPWRQLSGVFSICRDRLVANVWWSYLDDLYLYSNDVILLVFETNEIKHQYTVSTPLYK